MSEKVVRYKGKNYKANEFDNLSRKQMRTLRSALERANGVGADAGVDQQLDAAEALWDMVSVIFPSMSEKVLDDMGMHEAEDLLRRAGIIAGQVEQLGESSASTGS